MTGRSSRLGLGLTLLSVALWGAQPIAIALTVGKISGTALAFYKIASALLTLGAWLLARGGVPVLRGKSKGTLAILLLASLSLSLSYVTYNACFRYVSPGNAQVYVQLSRIFLSLAGIFVFREIFQAKQWFGLGALVFGIALFFHEQLGLSGNGYLTGVALVLVSAITWAGYAVAQKWLLRHFTGPQVLLIIYIVATALLFPWAQLAPLWELSRAEALALAFVCFSNVIAFVCFSEGLRHWEATKIGALSCLTPLVTFALSLAGGHAEPLGLLSLVGAVLVVGGAATVALYGKPA